MRRHLANFLLLISAVLLTMFLVDRWWQRLSQQAVSCLGCNVIIIDIDTFRADAFDCKGKPGDSGYPSNLCEFVRDAFKFENNFPNLTGLCRVLFLLILVYIRRSMELNFSAIFCLRTQNNIGPRDIPEK